MLTFLEKLAAGFWGLITRIVGLVLPFFAQGKQLQGLGTTLRWILHFVILFAILFGLWWLNTHTGLGGMVRVPFFIKLGLQDFWLPILFLLIYALSWLGWWLWKLMGPEEDLVE